MSALTYDENRFYLDGKEIRILSGSIHYFRVVPEYWEDRLRKLKECGMNAVETYVCWNLHEREKGVFDFSGRLDLPAFLETAKKLGLYVILRPGPYICAEWEMGGLPSRLLNIPGIRLRCCHEAYLAEVRAYLQELFARIRPYFYENGGNIIAVQLENEYGSYGNDAIYMEEIRKIYEACEVPSMWFTSDGPGYFMLQGGSHPEFYAGVNFGSNPKDSFALLKKFRPNQPPFCVEYWNGWFDHWYEKHHERDAGDTADVYRQMMELGASVNIYMFHGGTNFGLQNGANYGEYLEPTVTSYDYNALLTENGDLTDKYYMVRSVVEECFGKLPPLTVKNLPRRAYGKVELTKGARLFDEVLKHTEPVKAAYPMTMEELGLDFGFVLYRSTLKGPQEELGLEIDGLADRAIIFADGKRAGVKENTGHRNDQVIVGARMGEEVQIDILVENMGRVNYGGHILDKKGICRGVRVNNRYMFGWSMYPIRDAGDVEKISWEDGVHRFLDTKSFSPVYLKGEFTADVCEDTFVRLDGFHKGCVWVNGFLLGRYWNDAGPQKTLYLPGPLLKQGVNEIIVLELDQVDGQENGCAISLEDQPSL